MDNLSVTSVMDLQLTSDDEKYDDQIMMMAQCVEMELSAPIPVPGPSSSRLDCVNMQGNLAGYKTPDQKHSPPPVFDQSFFSLGIGNGPIRRDDRVRNNHPIKLCSKLTPLVDTPMSPHPKRGDWPPVYIQVNQLVQGRNRPWIRSRTTSKVWSLVDLDHW